MCKYSKGKIMRLFYLSLFSFFAASLFADDVYVPYPEEKVTQTQVQVQDSKPEIPDDLKGLAWNKWTTKNFIIISIDKDQGLYLKNNIEKIKSWLITRWGLEDLNFSSECKIVCVTNKNLLKRIFKLENSRFEIRKNDNNEIDLSVVWFSLEDYKKDMPFLEIMKICLAEYELEKKIPDFCNDGMSFLSQNYQDIKSQILENKDLLSGSFIDKDQEKMSSVQSGVVCLMMRKEYGQENFLSFLKNKNISCYGFDTEEKFDKTLTRFSKNLIEDLENNVTPKEYIEVNRR